MYPVHIKYPGTTVPEEGTCFIIAQEGILLRRETSWMRATIPVHAIGVLASEPIGVQLLVPPVDGAVLLQAITFLRAVYERYQSEGIVLLYYSKEGGWKLDVPEQLVERYRIIRYDTALAMDGYQCLGTIHSHADAAASHSSVDHEDEAAFDGIHITFGHCHNHNGVSVSAAAVINGSRFLYQLDTDPALPIVATLPGVFEVEWGRRRAPAASQYIQVGSASDAVVDPTIAMWLERVTLNKNPALYVIPAVPKKVAVLDGVSSLVPEVPIRPEVVTVQTRTQKFWRLLYEWFGTHPSQGG